MLDEDETVEEMVDGERKLETTMFKKNRERLHNLRRPRALVTATRRESDRPSVGRCSTLRKL